MARGRLAMGADLGYVAGAVGLAPWRRLILEVAAAHPGIGPLQEALK